MSCNSHYFKTKTFILKMSRLSYNSLPESCCNRNFNNLPPITEMSTDELFCDWLKQLQKVIELTFWQIVTYLQKLEVLLVYCNFKFWQSKRKCDSFLFCSNSLDSLVVVHKIFFILSLSLICLQGSFGVLLGFNFWLSGSKKVFLFNFPLK